MQQLDQKSRETLRAIYSRGLIRGRDLKRLANLNDDELRSGLKTLLSGNFVAVQGCSSFSDQNLLDVYVAPLPSKRTEAEYEMRQLG